MSDNESSCGPGLAAHAVIPAKLSELMAALAENLALHIPTLVLTDVGARAEHDAYSKLVDEHRSIAAQLAALAKQMTSYRDLPVAEHDAQRFEDPKLRDAYVHYVAIERELLTLLEAAVEHDERMLAGW